MRTKPSHVLLYESSLSVRKTGFWLATLKQVLLGVMLAAAVCGMSAGRADAQGMGLISIGPTSPVNGFPVYLEDRTGRALAPCLDNVAGDPCGIAAEVGLPSPADPVSFPANFPTEFFYWSAEARFNLPSGNLVRLIMAVEGGFGSGSVASGQQNAISRFRLRINGGLVPFATYTLTYPYGTKTVVAAADGTINVTADDGCPETQGCNFSALLSSANVGPFLTWDATAPAPPVGFIGDPATPHAITGSPFGTNFVRIAGPGIDTITNNLFLVTGRVFDLAAGKPVPIASNPPPSGGGTVGELPGEVDPPEDDDLIPIGPLNEKPIIADTTGIIVDKLAAQQLGKAFFWDAQAGSDGQACASCHYNAGADIRVKNQVNPGFPTPAGTTQFHARLTPSPGNDPSPATGPNVELGAGDFPFHRLADITDRNSAILYDTNDRFTSQGAFGPAFTARSILGEGVSSVVRGVVDVISGKNLPVGPDKCDQVVDPADPYNNGTTLLFRRVEPRNTPTNINAAFNFRQFWDGRANNIFNGVDPFGRRTNLTNPAAGILVATSPAKLPTLQKIEIANASLASQAVGPATSNFEMSCLGRTFADLGRRLLTAGVLAGQKVHPQDSLFSQTVGLIKTDDTGLRTTYAGLIQRAFNPIYWQNIIPTTITGTGAVQADPNGYIQMERNFSLFWGLAIQEYEALLISNQSPFDLGQLNDSQQRGLALFQSVQTGCSSCHTGPLLSSATVTAANANNPKFIESMILHDGGTAMYDRGFYNIGVRPSFEDLGLGGLDGTPGALDLSFSRQYKWQLLGRTDRVADPVVPNDPALPGFTPATSPRDAVDGSFKTPILRNVGLTPPYFHNGGQATLHDVVNFYNRGGDRRGPAPIPPSEQIGNIPDTTAYPLPAQAFADLLTGADVPSNLTQPPNSFGQANMSNLAPDIGDASESGLGLSSQNVDDIVNFLLALTDPRVACHADVFDHPELVLFLGQKTASSGHGSVEAADIKVLLPAVGKNGLTTCLPNTGELFGDLQNTFMSIVTPVK